MNAAQPLSDPITGSSVNRDMTPKNAYVLRAQLRRINPCTREKRCGLVVRRRDENASIVVTGDGDHARVRMDGVQTCNHVWSCPVCSMAITKQRHAEVVQSMLGLPSVWRMITLTLRHSSTDSLSVLLRGIYRALKLWRADGSVARWWRDHVVAMIRVVEITYGQRSGWHPHVHFLVSMQADFDIEKNQDVLSDAWARAVVSAMGRDHRPAPAIGFSWSATTCDTTDGEISRASSYVTKTGLEITGRFKMSPDGHYQQWALAAVAAAYPVGWAAKLWGEFVLATRGHRRLEESRGARLARKRYRDNMISDVFDESDPPGSKRISIPVCSDDLAIIRAAERLDPACIPRLLETVRVSKTPQTAYDMAMIVMLDGLSDHVTIVAPHGRDRPS